MLTISSLALISKKLCIGVRTNRVFELVKGTLLYTEIQKSKRLFTILMLCKNLTHYLYFFVSEKYCI